MPDINVPDVPPEILLALNHEAAERKVSISTIVSEAVAARYDVTCAIPPGRYGGGASSADLVVNVPEAIREALRLHGPGRGATLRAVTINALAERYGIGLVAEGRRPRTPTT